MRILSIFVLSHPKNKIIISAHPFSWLHFSPYRIKHESFLQQKETQEKLLQIEKDILHLQNDMEHYYFFKITKDGNTKTHLIVTDEPLENKELNGLFEKIIEASELLNDKKKNNKLECICQLENIIANPTKSIGDKPTASTKIVKPLINSRDHLSHTKLPPKNRELNQRPHCKQPPKNKELSLHFFRCTIITKTIYKDEKSECSLRVFTNH